MNISIKQLSAFQAWTSYNGAQRSEVPPTIHKLLRDTHPGYHITRTKKHGGDPLAYAAAGFATVTKQAADARGNGYDAVRVYDKAVTVLGVDQKPSSLADEISFGLFRYKWHQRPEFPEFLIYRILYSTLRGEEMLHFILADASDPALVVDGNHVATDALLLAVGDWACEIHEEIYVFDDSRWKKDHALWTQVQKTKWEDLILDQHMKDGLTGDVLSFFDSQEIYQTLAVPWKRGIILHGVPGNGKTVTIKALISSLAAKKPRAIPSLYVKSLDSCNGAKWSIRVIFEKARKLAPCMLIFEDLDSLVGSKLRSYFLNEVDGLESNEGILMVGSTNHLDKLDSAITKRPSRFDRKYHFRLPSLAEREMYARYWRSKLLANPNKGAPLDFPEEVCALIAQYTEGFSFAYLKELFVSSLLALARSGGVFKEEEHEDPVESDTLSAAGTDPVVVETPAAEDEKPKCDKCKVCKVHRKENRKKNAVPKSKPKPTIPKVDIPEHLTDNILLKFVRAQAQVLVEQMDNTNGDENANNGAGAARGYESDPDSDSDSE